MRSKQESERAGQSRTKCLSRRQFLQRSGGLALGLAGAGVLAACAPVAPPAAAPQAGAEAESAVIELTAYQLSGIITETEGDEIKTYTTELEAWMEANPGIQVTMEYVPGNEYENKMRTLAAAGELGDIFYYQGGALKAWANSGINIPLDDVASVVGYDLNRILPRALAYHRYDPTTDARGEGPLWGLPLAWQPGATTVFYNVDLFEEAGITPDPAWTVADLVVQSQALTVRNGEEIERYGYLPSPFWFWGVLESYARDFGGEMIDAEGRTALVNTAETKAAFTHVYNLIHTEQVAPTPETLDALGQYKPMFASQKLAMYRLPPWGFLGTLDIPKEGEEGHFEWNVLQAPAGPGGNGSSAGGRGWAISKFSQAPEAAFRVITEVFHNKFQCSGTYVCPPVNDLLNDTEFLGQYTGLEMAVQTAVEARAEHSPANGRSSDLGTVLGNLLPPLWNGIDQPTDAFFDDLNAAMQEVLDMPAA